MRSMLNLVPRAMVVLFAAMSVACASTGSEMVDDSAAAVAPGPDGVSIFTIQNNHTSRRDMIMYLEPEGRGERVQLGTAPAGETTSFERDVPRGYYRFIAGTDAGDIRSNRFNVSGASAVNWVMAANRLTVRRR
jgi:hypothetical protein